MGNYLAQRRDGREDWLDGRRRGIGSSDVGAILGLNPWRTPLMVWEEKTGRAAAWEESEPAYWGRTLEPVLSDQYVKESKRRVRDTGEHTLYWSRDTPFLFATPDRLIFTIDDRGPGLLEIKTTSVFKRGEWEGGTAPDYYACQLQEQLYCMSYRWGSFAVLLGGQKFVWMDVVRDDNWIRSVLLPSCRSFWDCVEADLPPQAAAGDNSRLAKLYGDEKPSPVLTLDAQLMETHGRNYDVIKDQLREIGREKDTIEAQVKQLMETNEECRFPDSSGFTWKTDARGRRIFRRKEAH